MVISSKYPILVTGAAGFIGAALCRYLLEKGENVIGIDNLNDYYDVSLKTSRLDLIRENSLIYKGFWRFKKISIENSLSLKECFVEYKPSVVVHLAAQAGVRHSIKNPSSYVNSNLVGFANILEECRRNEISNFIYASSSSVYGGNAKLPYSEEDPVNHPISFYAATKKSNELMAHSYSHLYNIPSTGLRFFTVYGPWGRPDMAPMIFAKSIISRKPIKIFNYGNMKRDFTYIDDIVKSLYLCIKKKAIPNLNFNKENPDPGSSFAPHRIFNIGNSDPINLLDFIRILEEYLGIEAIKDFQPIQQGDVRETEANNSALESWIGFKNFTSIHSGIRKFIKWYREFYKI